MSRIQLLTATSMGVRITPADRQPTGIGNLYTMQATSAESNVLNVAASLGMNTRVLTRFVAGSPIASFIKGELRRRNIHYEGPEIEPDGPWGVRHQFNIADSGYGMRGPRVYNDRAGEVGRTIAPQDFDLNRIFREEGVDIVHISGLFASMSESTGETCLRLAELARETGARLSFDLNYRASFWKGRQQALRDIFTRIAERADILIGNEEDFQLALGIEGPEAGGNGLSDQVDAFKAMIANARQRFPQVSTCATTLREVVDANEHLWGAIMLDQGHWYYAEPRAIRVLDRIGGGDGFVAGLLYAKLRGWSAEDCLHFGWATGAMAVTMLEDYATPADEAQVWNVWKGNARIVR
ncbi:MAG: sugar kinase [Clostridia bacterium]|nr:sugar kinase [Clostridia bacterium]